MCIGFSAGGGIIVAQNFGRNETDKVKSCIVNTGYLMILVPIFIGLAAFSIIMLPIFQIFKYQIISIFVNDSEVIEMGAHALKIMSFFYISLGLIIIVRGVLNGIGDAFFALLSGFVEVLGRFTIPFILTAIPMIGVWGIWWNDNSSSLTSIFFSNKIIFDEKKKVYPYSSSRGSPFSCRIFGSCSSVTIYKKCKKYRKS